MLAPIVVHDGSVRSSLDGIVSLGRDVGARRRVVVTPEREGILRPDEARTYDVPAGTTLAVHTGDRVAKGQWLTPSNSALKGGIAALAAARLNEPPSIDRLVEPADFADLKRLEQQRAARRSAETDRVREEREQDDTRKARKTEAERRARRLAAAGLPNVEDDTEETKKRAKTLIASIEPAATGGPTSAFVSTSILTSIPTSSSARSGQPASSSFGGF
jgi:hypothetical protein